MTRTIKAKFTGKLGGCGCYVSIGDPIAKTSRGWSCARHAAGQAGGPPAVPTRERLLEDPKIRALLCKALVTDSPPEALTALTAARARHIRLEKQAEEPGK